METNWTGKRILITGGTSGLGRALASELIRLGAQVGIVARDEDRLEETLRRAGSHRLIAIRGDVASKHDIYRISAEAYARLGGIDALVNNASYLGATPLRLLADTDCEDFEEVLQTNLLGPFRLTKAVLPAMLLRKSGLILNIVSDAGITPYPRWGSYGSSKAALAQLSRIWDEELRSHGVRVVAVDPGDMDTPMHRAAIPEADPATLLDPQEAASRILDCVRTGRYL